MRRRGEEQGQALIELGIVLVLLVTIALGLLTFGHTFMVANMITHVARDGARLAATWPNRGNCAVLTKGVVPVLAAFVLTAITAIAAIAIEVSRPTDTATEVQVAADAAALAAAQNMINGGSTGTATTAAETVADSNRADGRPPAVSDVSIDFGNYAVAGGFTSGSTPTNDVHATVPVTNVRYLLATMFGSGSATTVTKSAVATCECLANG